MLGKKINLLTTDLVSLQQEKDDEQQDINTWMIRIIITISVIINNNTKNKCKLSNQLLNKYEDYIRNT